jgi:LCP family protein required for cell wall assembly
VVKVFHVDPQAGTISVLSIPRDTIVSLLRNQGLFGNYNRINVNYQSGPTLLVQTIEANFGIPINHVIQVSFGGLDNAVNALGGVYMSFPYPALDRLSSLDIHRTGCQLLNGFQALAVARSRHFYYLQNGQWLYDGTSDFGRIDRQNQFLRALIDRAKSEATNLPAIASFLSAIPQGVEIDDTFGYNELLGLALKFHSFNPSTMAAYTLPTLGVNGTSLGDVLFVDQPAAQQLLVRIFGQVGTLGGLTQPTNPPPVNASFQTPAPPAVATPRVAPPAAGHHHVAASQPLHTEPWYTFNPIACTPGVKAIPR